MLWAYNYRREPRVGKHRKHEGGSHEGHNIAGKITRRLFGQGQQAQDIPRSMEQKTKKAGDGYAVGGKPGRTSDKGKGDKGKK